MNVVKKSLVVDGNEVFDFIDEAISNDNIKDIEFRNCDFLNEDILKLINFLMYDRIAFINCTFENETLIKNIKTKSLSLTNNKITSYEFVYEMTNLENLTIVGGKIDAYKISFLKNLEYLRVSNSNIINIENLFLEKLKYLFIDNTNVIDLSFISKFYNLELLSISEKQKLYNKEFLITLKDRVDIIIDGIIEMECFFDE